MQTGEAQVVRELCRNICVFGGPTMAGGGCSEARDDCWVLMLRGTGFVERMSEQMRADGPPGLDIKVRGWAGLDQLESPT